MMIRRPEPHEYAPFYAGYVSLVPEGDLVALLQEQPGMLRRLAASVPPDGEGYRYGPGKWSIRQVFGHIGDGERAFAFRLFCFSRTESAPLPGFDENTYVDHSRFDSAPLADLLGEFADLRSANLAMIRRLEEDDWSLAGTASDNRVTTRALAYIMAGHVLHHTGILKTRYGVGGGSS
jgi:hypothetical protein